MALITTAQRDQLSALFIAMFKAAPGANNLSDMVAAVEAGQTIYQVATTLAAKADFAKVYPGFLTGSEFADRMIANLLPASTPAAAKTWSKDWILGKLNAGESRASILATAVVALTEGPGVTNANYAAANAQIKNQVEVSNHYSITKEQSATDLTTLQNVISGVTADAATVTTAKTNIDTVANDTTGAIFTLTANADVLSPDSLTVTTKTTGGDDTIYANSDGFFSAADVINGGGGVDTLYSVQDVGAAETLTPILTSVERVFIDINDTTSGTASTFTFNGSTSTGLQEIWVNAFSGSQTGNEDTFAITNVAKDVVTGIKGGDGEYHVTTTYLSTTGTADSATLALDAASVDTVTIDGIETLSITNSGTGNSTIATLTATSLGTLNISGSKNLTVTNNIDFKDATDTLAFDGTVNASSATGNVTLTLGTGGDNVKFTGGSGKNTVVTGGGNDSLVGGAADDTFTPGAGADTIIGGAGNDRVIIAGNLDTSDSIDLGEGSRDALILNVATLNAAGVDAAALALVNKVGGLEVIGTSGALTAIDASYFNQTVYEATADLVAAVAMTNVAGDTLLLSGNGITGVNGDALTVSGALPNQTFTLELKGAAAVKVQATDGGAGNAALTIASGISTVNLVSNTSSTTAVTNEISLAGATTATHSIDNVSAGSFVLTGSTNLTIGSGLTAGFTKAVDFNASAFTGVLSIVGSAEADIIKGGSKDDIINGGDGDDILTGGAGKDTFVFISGHGSAAPSATVFETITDYQKGVDIIDWDATLTYDVAAAAATATVAQVNAEGIATFHADDDTLAERIVAAAKGFDANGDFAVFEFNGDTYVLISGDGNNTLDAADALIKLVGVTGITDTTIDGNGNLILA